MEGIINSLWYFGRVCFFVLDVKRIVEIVMRYLIHPVGHEPFFTNWFGDGLVPEGEYVCYDLWNKVYTRNGNDWNKINEDHL